MSVIGIDYGNLDCVIAQAKRGGIDIILNENSNRKNPNMICFQGKQRLIGEAAISVARMHFKNTATDVKRLLGRPFDHPDTQNDLARLPFRCVEIPEDGSVGIILNTDGVDVTYRCEQLAAMMLAKCASIAAAANVGTSTADTVISCPAYFSDAQRRALLDASAIAGLKCLRIINEHTAIALAFGIYKSARNLFHESEPMYTMFIDLGHSAYTVTVVAFVQGKLEVKSTMYDRFLGGRDFDVALAEHVAKEFEAKYPNTSVMSNAKSRMKLLAACEKAKKNLSPAGVNSTNVNIECLVEEYDYNGKLSLEVFQELISPLLAKLEAPIVAALKEAGIEASDLNSIEIVGGGTRVSSVKQRLAEILNLDQTKNNMGLSTTLNADEAVARGCALQCAILSPQFKVKEFLVADKVLFPVTVSWDPKDNVSTSEAAPMDTEDMEEDAVADAGNNQVLIFTRADDFPKTKRITLKRTQAFELEAAYDDSALGFLPENTDLSLGKFSISGLPEPVNEDVPRIRVNVKQDLNGIFGVSSCQLMQEIIEAPAAPVETPAEEAKSEEEAKKSEEEPKSTTTEEAKTSEEEAKTTTTEEAKTDKPEAPKKKRFKKVELKVTSACRGLSPSALQTARETELNMAQQDRILEETANKRNELESYVYDTRTVVSEQWAEYMTSESRSAFETQLQDMEDWLYSDEGFDSTKSVYVAKLSELTAVGKPVEIRKYEHSERPIAQSELQSILEDYKKLANSTDEAYAHWTDADREIIRTACTETETWFYEQLALQADLSLTVEPILKSAEIRKKGLSLRDSCKPVLSKPKPAPVVEEVPEGETKKEEAKEAEMDLD